jgi:hypothetical protein
MQSVRHGRLCYVNKVMRLRLSPNALAARLVFNQPRSRANYFLGYASSAIAPVPGGADAPHSRVVAATTTSRWPQRAGQRSRARDGSTTCPSPCAGGYLDGLALRTTATPSHRNSELPQLATPLVIRCSPRSLPVSLACFNCPWSSSFCGKSTA